MKESKRGRKPLAADAGAQAAAAPGSRQAPQPHVTEQGQSLATDGAVAGIEVLPEEAGVRLDQFLASRLPEVSRVRVQQLIEQRKILLNGSPAKSSHKLKGGEHIEVVGEVRPAPLRAVAEDIPLDVVYEDRDLAVINKPAGMMVHAGAGTRRRSAQSGNAGQCAALPLREIVRGKRRAASGNRPPARQRHQRLAHRR